jgi:hypothetical protein
VAVGTEELKILGSMIIGVPVLVIDLNGDSLRDRVLLAPSAKLALLSTGLDQPTANMAGNSGPRTPLNFTG